MQYCSIFFYLAAAWVCVDAQSNYDTSTLLYSHVLFRHGDRTPDSSCKALLSNPNITYFPEGYGALTLPGKNREFSIGRNLRQRYGSFLGDVYYSGVMEAISTNVPRTMMSLQLVNAGLWPPNGDQTWNWELDWQPIPYTYVSITNDSTFGYQAFYCPKYMAMFNAIMNTTQVKTNINQPSVKDVTDYIANHSTFTLSSNPVTNAYIIYTCLATMVQTYQPIPDWVKPIFPTQLKKVATLAYILQTWDNALMQYAGGPLVQKIITNAESTIAGKMAPQKLSLYSAHEFNVAQFARALNIFNPPFFPDYGSQIIVELHKITGVYGFKVFLQNYAGSTPILMTISGCTAFCPFLKFKEIMAQRLPPANITC